jgi:hypothetical protein
VIESFIEGRVRLRSPLFADPVAAKRVSEELLKIGCVQKAEVNPRTNGLLLEYDKKSLPMSRLLPAAPILEELDGLANAPPSERLDAAGELLAKLKDILQIECTESN